MPMKNSRETQKITPRVFFNSFGRQRGLGKLPELPEYIRKGQDETADQNDIEVDIELARYIGILHVHMDLGHAKRAVETQLLADLAQINIGGKIDCSSGPSIPALR
jgi:hypothetical protein